MAKTLDGRVVFSDLLRVFGILGTMVLLVIGDALSTFPVQSEGWWALDLYAGLFRWCLPVFVMVSGMFLLDPKRALPLPKLFFHNCLRLVICLVFWTALYATADYVSAGGSFTWRGLWHAVLEALGGRGGGYLRPIFLFLGLYLVSPILRAFVKGATLGTVRYFLVLAFLWASLLPMVFQLWPGATAELHAWYDALQIRLVLGYVGYFVLGWYLREHTISRLTEAVVYVLGVLGAVATVGATAAASRRAGAFVDLYYDWTAPNVVLFSAAVVVLFRYVLGVSDERSRRERLSHMAEMTFGMFLVCGLFLRLLNFFGLGVGTFAPVASVPLLSAAVFLCSFALAWLLRRIPFLGPWLT